jgi:hypothetical protein
MKIIIVEDKSKIKGLNDYKIISINDVKEKFHSDKSAVNWIKKIASIKVGGKNIKEYLAFEDISIWWWMESWVYSSYVFETPIRDVIRYFDLVNYIILKEKPESIIVLKDSSLLQKIVLLIAKNKNISIEFKKSISLDNIKNIVIKKSRILMIDIYLTIKPYVRKVYWKFIRKNKIKRNKILFLSWLPYEKTRTKEGNIILKDKYLEDIYSRLKKHSIIVDCPHKLGFELEKLKKKVERESEIIECFESYKRLIDNYYILKQKKILTKKFNKLINNQIFIDSFIYKGINIHSLVLPQFKRYFKSRLKHHLSDYYILKRLMDKLEPSIVVSPSETELNILPFSSVCYKKGIPTIGIQHGTMGYHTNAVHTKEEVSKKMSCLSPYFPIPTKTAVWGEDTKRFLIKYGNYPKENIVITGNPRYDVLAFKDRIYNKKQTKETYKIKTNKKILLLCTNPVVNEADMIKKVCKVAKKLNVFLIIKPHPAEYFTNMHEKIAKKYLKDYIIAKGADTFELLYICDLLITPMSTVIYEAMIFEKPTILVNFSNLKDYIDFSFEKALILVNDINSLEKYIKKILYEKNYIKCLKKYMADFRYRNTYKNDGKASLRVIQLIKKMQKF